MKSRSGLIRLAAPPIALVVMVTVLAACGGPKPSSAELSDRRLGKGWNVVIIVIDTLRQDRVSAYGYERETSPRIDRLAADGALVDAVSPTSWTKPATVSILTGLHPIRHNAFSRNDLLNDDVITAAEFLRAHGYRTVGLSANLWISQKWNVPQGFDVFYDMGELGYGHVAKADMVNEVASDLLGELQSPFFLYLHYVDPHVPYDPPISWDGGALDPELAARTPMDNDDFSPLSFAAREPEVVRAASDLYDGEVRFVDKMVGEFIDELGHRGLMSSTLLVITSDHGEEFEDHGRMGHGHTVFSEQTNVPLVFHAPGLIPAGQLLPRSSLMDVFPTIADLIALGDSLNGSPYDLDGQSLATALLEGDPGLVGNDRSFLAHLDIDTGRSLAFEENSNRLFVSKEPYFKGLFDLNVDPREQDNLMSDASQQLFEGLADNMAVAYNTLHESTISRVKAGELEEEVTAGLRALGYVVETKDEGRRLFPRFIGAPSPDAGGLLGIERTDEFESCVDIGSEQSLQQLLAGWHPAKHDQGRWTHPEASIALRFPVSGPMLLQVAGISHRIDTCMLRAFLDGNTILETEIRPGRFDLRTEVDPRPVDEAIAVVHFEITPPFRPLEHGMKDPRILGMFFNRICIE